MRYKVNEIFYSLQGEGFNTGTPAVFVRLSGCNLRCNFCDTAHHDGEMLSVEEIASEANRYPNAGLIVLTGGEPSLFINDEFVATLKQLTDKKISIETNGTHALPQGLDWVTLSPKTGFDGGDAATCVLKKCDELKVVYIGQNLDYYDCFEADYRFLQPCYVDDAKIREENIKATVKAVMTNPGWRLSMQTHRILGIQ